jgi:CRISPR-associated protein Csd1
MLDKGSKPHLSRLGKDRKGQQINLEKDVSGIMQAMSPGDDPFPSHLPDKQQGLFALGYYHQRNTYFSKSDSKSNKAAAEETTA